MEKDKKLIFFAKKLTISDIIHHQFSELLAVYQHEWECSYSQIRLLESFISLKTIIFCKFPIEQMDELA